jgi:hypothetical protein
MRIILVGLALMLVVTMALAQQAPWDGHTGQQCCTCCEGGTMIGRERQCITTTTDRCRARGWVCQGYVMCPR